MNRKQILETLVKAYHEEMRNARVNMNLNEPEMASQSLHQAYGIEKSAEALGINREDFQNAYKAYRSLQYKLNKYEG